MEFPLVSRVAGILNSNVCRTQTGEQTKKLPEKNQAIVKQTNKQTNK